jgi:hypothetical protein
VANRATQATAQPAGPAAFLQGMMGNGAAPGAADASAIAERLAPHRRAIVAKPRPKKC